jgi:predicted glycosyltransferase
LHLIIIKLQIFVLFSTYCFTKLQKINRKIIIAVLDWGLGHATRCIPIANEILKHNIHIVLAGTAETHALFTAEGIDFEPLLLPSYQIKYKKKLLSHRLYLLLQIPRLKKIIKQEQAIINQYCKVHYITTIVSDNRYGVYESNTKNIFITHQLEVQTGLGNFLNKKLQALHYKMLGPFHEIWIPDVKDPAKSLSGKLAHTVMPNKPVHYIGALSRCKPQPNMAKNFACCFLISGPEPYKSIFIRDAIALANRTSKPVAIVTGNVLQHKNYQVNKNITIYNHLPTKELVQLIEASAFVICRSGYSSIMDLCALQAKAIILPTPSQTEQEYLAKHIHQQGWAVDINTLEEETIESLQQKVASYTFNAWPVTEALHLPISYS